MNPVLRELQRQLNDIAKQLAALQRQETVLSNPATYSGTPVAGNYAYWTGAGTVSDSGFGTAQLPRYSGTPTANSLAYWTGAGTVAAATFGTADVVLTSGDQTIAGAKTFTSAVISESAVVGLFFRSETVSVNDDQAIALPNVDGRGILILVNGNRNGESGMFSYRAQSSPYMVDMTPDVATLVNTSTSVLSGTTGTDGFLTLSATSGGTVYLENRSGVNLPTVRYVRMG